jgi:hypothetical protein
MPMAELAAPGRYRMVNVTPGHVVLEHDLMSRAVRSYFSAEQVAPIEEYREGEHIWHFAGTAQSFQFDLLDHETGQVIPCRELLGLMYYGCAKPDSPLRRVGEVAHDNGVSVYVAIAYENPDGSVRALEPAKVRALNTLFNERLRTPGKKILILPDVFDLYKTMSYGEIMIDFGLTSLESE